MPKLTGQGSTFIQLKILIISFTMISNIIQNSGYVVSRVNSGKICLLEDGL
jgi:hypothetical protein